MYLDGRESRYGAVTANSASFGSVQTADGQTLAFGYYAMSPKGIRLSFCDGTSVDVAPLVDEPPYWLGAELHSDGEWPSEASIVDGRATNPSSGTCPPPSTVARAGRAIPASSGIRWSSLDRQTAAGWNSQAIRCCLR